MGETRTREEILESLQENARGLTEDLQGLGHSIEDAASPKAWLRNNPAVAVLVGAAIVGTGVLAIYMGRSKIMRAVFGGVASAVGSVAAAQIGRWLRRRIAERLMGDDGMDARPRRASRRHRRAEAHP
jgi:hypothetical protein